ncbi:hypothetical protein [Derxia lacustris]|uniref:hypothetical protein n=1 Tax=Derxia lacustris TaxID=764842 RepID=UPI001593D3C9|nr:hypothetical protein [Derxia lacustris]
MLETLSQKGRKTFQGANAIGARPDERRARHAAARAARPAGRATTHLLSSGL